MTNRRDMIDEALLRPGRLEVQVEISLPNEEGRVQILDIHTARMKHFKKISPDVDLYVSVNWFPFIFCCKIVNFELQYITHAINLTNSNQFVDIDGIKFEEWKITFYIPQGSVLGPLLFFWFINDVPNVVTDKLLMTIVWGNKFQNYTITTFQLFNIKFIKNCFYVEIVLFTKLSTLLRSESNNCTNYNVLLWFN